uniref:Uncharacterized protein n=1 Tax=Oryza rufipogon TaxID=4529 RepID=A0A0E0R1Z5_ORYRU
MPRSHVISFARFCWVVARLSAKPPRSSYLTKNSLAIDVEFGEAEAKSTTHISIPNRVVPVEAVERVIDLSSGMHSRVYVRFTGTSCISSAV